MYMYIIMDNNFYFWQVCFGIFIKNMSYFKVVWWKRFVYWVWRKWSVVFNKIGYIDGKNVDFLIRNF